MDVNKYRTLAWVSGALAFGLICAALIFREVWLAGGALAFSIAAVYCQRKTSKNDQ